MKWTVTYRGKSGKTETKVFEAESRNALFPLLKSDGIIPIRVVEGAVKCDSSTPKWVLLLIGLVVIVAAACLMWFLFSCGSNNASSTDKAKRVIATEPTQRIKNTQYRVQYQKPAKTGDKLTDALAEVEAAENALTINAAPKIKIPPGYTNRTFKTGVEQLMSWVFTTEVGDMPMPIPAISDEDRKQLAVILVSKNEIKDGRRRTFVRAEMLNYDNGEQKLTFDPNEINIYVLPKGATKDDLIQSDTDNLRVNEQIEALNTSLNILGNKVGFENDHYKYDGAKLQTATAVIASNSKMFRRKKKLEIGYEVAIYDLAKAICYVSSTFGKYNINTEDMVIQFDDGVLEDTESIANRAMREVNAGLLSRVEYRTKVFRRN